METKKEKVAAAKIMLEAMGLSVEDLFENVETSPKNVPHFLDIQKINDVPCMYLFYNKETQKHELLCLEVPKCPRMDWEKGRFWCTTKGGNYGDISTLKFISEHRDKINQVLKDNSHPLIECGFYWSNEHDYDGARKLSMYNGNVYGSGKYASRYVRAVVTTD